MGKELILREETFPALVAAWPPPGGRDPAGRGGPGQGSRPARHP